MSEVPRTAAGRALLDSLPTEWHPINTDIMRDHILAIEAEAATVGQDALLSFLGTPNAAITGADYKRATQTLKDYLAEAADRCPWITSTNHLSYRCGLQRGHALPHEPIRARPTEQQGSRG